MWKKSYSILFLLLSIATGIGAQSDSLTLSYEEFIKNITQFHPISKQADLQIEEAALELLRAKGNFDPMLYSNWNEKNFDDKLYYQIFQGKFTIPTPIGIDLTGGYENTRGVFLNPENKTDSRGLWSAGIEADLIQGLLINERRVQLQQAAVYQDLAENERQIILNDLLYSASIAYFEWQKFASILQVIQTNISLAQAYFESTKQAYFQGEKTGMDTLEVFIVYQDAINLAQKYEADLIQSRQHLENFLWFDNLPVELNNTTQPEPYSATNFQIPSTDLPTLLSSHPLLLEKINKQDFFEIEQRLKREKLKPKLKAKYNPLLSTSEDNIAPNYSLSDYKWGFDFSFPLFLRTERANLQKADLKLREIGLDLQNKRNEIQNKIESSLAQQRVINDQINLLEKNVDGYRRLLALENEKYRLGESSVFLLNKRQEKFVNGQVKLIELRYKYRKEILSYLYYTNTLRGF